MAGHIKKHGPGKWLITVEAGKDPGTGKRKRIRRVFEGKKADAERELARLVAEAEKGTFLDTSKMTFGEYLTAWLEDYGSIRLSPTTQRRYSQIINLRVIPKLGQVPLNQLKPFHIQNFYRQLIEEGRLDGKGPLSHASIVYHHRVIHKALDSALKQQLIQVNPADAVEIPKPPPTIDDADEVENVKVLKCIFLQTITKNSREAPGETKQPFWPTLRQSCLSALSEQPQSDP